LIEILSRAHANGQKEKRKEKKSNDFRFGTPIARFVSDGAASMVVKGLI